MMFLEQNPEARRSLPGALIKIATAGLLLAGLASCGQSDGPATGGGPPVMRRLTEQQYRQSISDIFGTDIKVAGRFEPNLRKDGLIAVGASAAAISPAGFEQYERMADAIAAQVVDEQHRAKLVPCTPKAATEPDDACAAKFLAKYGRLLFRRPPREETLRDRVADAAQAAHENQDFYGGLQYALAAMLYAPEFLFQVELPDADTDHPDLARLDSYSAASRLSFFLWNAPPDEELLAAAQGGLLNNKRTLQRQVDRMLASPRLEAGFRAFLVDFFDFDGFDELAKDPVIYPAFSPKTASDAREQTLLTAIDLLIRHDGDYRDIFTSRRTFLTRTLGLIYDVPVKAESGWEPHEFPPNDPRAGIQTEISFTALHSHPGRSSPTIRGKAFRELLLCQHVPAPPSNVDFSVVQDTSNPQFKTAKERLTAHRKNPTCAGCHKIMDPIGIALENFDGSGAYRNLENGAVIDATGDLDGQGFSDPAGLGQAIHDNPATTSCLVNSLYRYGAGRGWDPGERSWQSWLNQSFASDGYRISQLLRRIAMSDAFYAVPKPSKPLTKEAMK
jgi:Protein of unknown function (DUF1592)/Protein of unknown function (DUF1588)/Protein of unknown function (DUF1585)/Protein of unknown function (DUF1595)/Protein of unknown function (DUF1587)